MNTLLTRAIFIPSLLVDICQNVIYQRNWWDKVSPQLILGAMPFHWQVKKLHDLGVRHVINMCVEYQGPKKTYQKFNIRQTHFPTLDFRPPSFQHITKAVQIIQEEGKDQSPVYCHCKAGRGRSATVALCFLMAKFGHSPQLSENQLRELRPQVDVNLYKRKVVERFSTSLTS